MTSSVFEYELEYIHMYEYELYCEASNLHYFSYDW